VTVAEAGVMLSVKSGAASTTSEELALWVRDPAVPVRANGYVPTATFCV